MMMISKKSGSLIVLVVMVLLVGYVVQVVEKGKLLIWINGDKGYDGIIKIGEKFIKEIGILVVVEYLEDVIVKFEQVVVVGKGLDIWMWLYDCVGSWVMVGLIVLVMLLKKIIVLIDLLVWKVWIIGGKIWGYLLFIEVLGLIYNKVLVFMLFKIWEEVLVLDKKLQVNGKYVISWLIMQIYYIYGLILVGGGYVFKCNVDGSYDLKDMGVNNVGLVKGIEILMKLVNVGVVFKMVDYVVIDFGVNDGSIVMMINGLWSWNNLKKSKIDFGVVLFLKVVGKQGGFFVGVFGVMFSSVSLNKEFVNEFMENYLLLLEGLKVVNVVVLLGVLVNKEFYVELKFDLLIVGMMVNVQVGILMFNNLEMMCFWFGMEVVLQNIMQGCEIVKEGLDCVVKCIKGIE